MRNLGLLADVTLLVCWFLYKETVNKGNVIGNLTGVTTFRFRLLLPKR